MREKQPIDSSKIEAFASEVARRFQPEKIILFGSRARGKETAGSDVDMLVILEHNGRNVEKALEIEVALDPRFALDLLVRRPSDIETRISMNDLFMREIVETGVVLYERYRI